MTNPHRCVIDSKKMYVTFVIIDKIEGKEIPQHYTLKNGETLIEANPPIGLKSQWTGENWRELATPEEIEVDKKAKYEAMGLPWPPVPVVPPIDENLLTQLAIAEVYEKQIAQDEDILMTQLAVAEIYELLG